MRIYQAFARGLIDHGVETIFGLMGDANMLYLVDYQQRGGRFVAVVHEGSSVCMADVYARTSRRLGVASVTHGPGLTNTLTSLTEAVRAQTPLLVITGDTPLDPTHAQAIDLAAVATAAGAGYDKVYSAPTLMRDLNRAVQRAIAERRPIVFNLAFALLDEDASEQVSAVRPVSSAPRQASDADIDEALGALASAKRPIILAGRGAVAAGAREELIELSGRVGALLATTALAKDLFVGHPRDIGIFGHLANDVATMATASADCVAVFGASISTFTSYHGVLSDKRLLQIDDDPARFGAVVPVDIAVVGDAAGVARTMNELLAGADISTGSGWVDGIEKALAARSPSDSIRDSSGVGTVDLRLAMIRLDSLLPADRTLISDVGRFVVGVWPYVRVPDAERFTMTGVFGSIGLGLAGAIGAAAARPGSLTVAATGDGGFMMHAAEFTTAVRQRLPILVVVVNDSAYGAEHFKLKRDGFDPKYALNDWPDLAGMATAMGGRGITVRSLSDLDPIAGLVAEMDGPLLVDVRVESDVDLAW